MAKATLTLPDGTIVTVTGSAEEIASIMSLHGASTKPSGRTTTASAKGAKKVPASKKSGKSRGGPKQRIQALVDAGFFKERKSINDIQAKLEEEGHIYAQSSLSPALVRLTRDKALRRVKHDNKWAYVNP
jgi:hypothetical protein